jgi:hypothetical protein
MNEYHSNQESKNDFYIDETDVTLEEKKIE